MTKLQNKLKFIFKKSQTLLFYYFKYFTMVEIITLYFFAYTFIGYCISIFCFFYGFFGCLGNDCNITHFLSAMLVITALSISLQTYIVLKIPSSRKYMEFLVGKEFLESYLGKYVSTAAATGLSKMALPVLCAGVIEVATITTGEYFKNYNIDKTRQRYYNDLANHNQSSDMNSKAYKKLTQECRKIAKKPVHGVLTQGLHNEKLKTIAQSTAESASSVFKVIFGKSSS